MEGGKRKYVRKVPYMKHYGPRRKYGSKARSKSRSTRPRRKRASVLAPKRKYVRKIGAHRENRWISHVKNVAASQGIPYRSALKVARATYRR